MGGMDSWGSNLGSGFGGGMGFGGGGMGMGMMDGGWGGQMNMVGGYA